jgi:HAD superfamily hydrolase (TIGR01509 family)
MTRLDLAFAAGVFDCDGLLVDTAACWRFAFEAAAGQTLPEEVHSALAGASTRTGAELLSRRLGRSIAPEDIEAGLHASLKTVELRPLPGVEEFLETLRGHLPLAVATNGSASFVDAVLGERLRRFFQRVVASAEAGADKPASDVYLAACAALGVAPADAVAFEDSPPGAQSARAAGLAVVVVNAEPQPEAKAAAHLVVARIDDPLVAAFLRSGPLGDD